MDVSTDFLIFFDGLAVQLARPGVSPNIPIKVMLDGNSGLSVHLFRPTAFKNINLIFKFLLNVFFPSHMRRVF